MTELDARAADEASIRRLARAILAALTVAAVALVAAALVVAAR